MFRVYNMHSWMTSYTWIQQPEFLDAFTYIWILMYDLLYFSWSQIHIWIHIMNSYKISLPMNSYATLQGLWTQKWIHVYEEYSELFYEIWGSNYYQCSRWRAAVGRAGYFNSGKNYNSLPCISKLPIAKTLRNLRNLAKWKTYLRNLAKILFAKACENLYLWNLANLAKQT